MMKLSSSAANVERPIDVLNKFVTEKDEKMKKFVTAF